MQVLSCICDILAIFCDGFKQIAQLVRLIATLVFYCTLGWYAYCITIVAIALLDFHILVGIVAWPLR